MIKQHIKDGANFTQGMMFGQAFNEYGNAFRKMKRAWRERKIKK